MSVMARKCMWRVYVIRKEVLDQQLFDKFIYLYNEKANSKLWKECEYWQSAIQN